VYILSVTLRDEISRSKVKILEKVFKLIGVFYFYAAQSNLPWFHSWVVPIMSTIRKRTINIIETYKFLTPVLMTNGNIKTSSTSKTRKINAIKKNRIENGNRALNLGENPHSNGLIFSKSNNIFFLNRIPAINTTLIKIISLNITMIKRKIF